MTRIAIFTGNGAQLKEIHCLLEKEFAGGGECCHLTAFSDTKKLLDYLEGDGGGVDIVLFDLRRQNDGYLRAARAIAKGYPDIDLLCISKPPLALTDGGAPPAEQGLILSTPVLADDLEGCLAKAVRTLTRYESGKLTVVTKSQTYRLRHSRIDYVVSSNRQLTFHSGEKELCVYGKLSELEAKLGEGFVRCHQSYLVNAHRIMAFDKGGHPALFRRQAAGLEIPLPQSLRKVSEGGGPLRHERRRLQVTHITKETPRGASLFCIYSHGNHCQTA